VAFDPETIRSRLRELAFLNSSATIHFRVLGQKKSGAGAAAAAIGNSDGGVSMNGNSALAIEGWETYHYSGGLVEYVRYLNRDKQPVHDPFFLSKEVMTDSGPVQVEVAMQWCSDAFSDTLIGFVNSIKTVDGGTHMDGFKTALTRTGNFLSWAHSDPPVVLFFGERTTSF